MLAIIPAAGFGTRMGMRVDQSKEMLTNAVGRHLIDRTLDICNRHNLQPLVITRLEKNDLREYCAKRGAAPLIIEPKGEWYDTVLQSKDYWQENNILILPDTEFDDGAIYDILFNLNLGCMASIAIHNVKDGYKWGTLKDYSIFEKDPSSTYATAWGVIGFKKEYGEELFSSMGTKVPFKLRDTSFVRMEWFEDVTRG